MRKSVFYILTVVFAWILLISSAEASSRFFNIADSAFYQNYTYIRFVNSENDVKNITDEEFFDNAGRLIFPVNKAELSINDSLLVELTSKVLPQINRDSLQLLRIMLRGAASPEGSFATNKVLGERRAQVLLDFLNSKLSLPLSEEVLRTHVEVEDYRSLCLMMHRANDRDYALVAELCDRYLPDGRYAELKQDLRRVRNGQLWNRLLRDYFPRLRAVRFMLLVKSLPAPPPEEVKPPEPEPVVVPPPAPEPLPESRWVRQPRREFLSIKTNLLLDVAYVPGYDKWCPIPNIAVEYYPRHGHFTYGASVDFPWWRDYSNHKFFEVRNYQLETRYYFRANETNGANGVYRAPAYRGFYLQGYVHAGIFQIGFDADRGWIGEGVGAGVGIGYVTPISRNGHWRLEFSLQAGWFGCKHDPFQYENPINPDYRDGLYYYKWTLSADLFKERQYRFDWVGPTRVGITLSYDLLYRRNGKKGVSFKNYEEAYETYGANGANETDKANEAERRVTP